MLTANHWWYQFFLPGSSVVYRGICLFYQMSPWTQKGQIRVRHEYFSLVQTFMLVMFYRTSVGKEHICAEHTNAAQLNCYKLVVDPPSTRLFRREALVLHGSAIDGSDDKVLENFCLPVF